jgi:hypothetical protein
MEWGLGPIFYVQTFQEVIAAGDSTFILYALCFVLYSLKKSINSRLETLDYFYTFPIFETSSLNLTVILFHFCKIFIFRFEF